MSQSQHDGAVFRWLVRVSRPRFWGYLAGPWMVGYLAGLGQVEFYASVMFWVGLLYFSWPANLFVYGINDWSDGDTDALNPKKEAYETKYSARYRTALWFSLAGVLVLTLGFVSLLPWASVVALGVWALLSAGYSVPPLRLKARPWVDSLSNVLYVLPGLVGFLVHQPLSDISWCIVLAAGLWSAGMHLFSALPDKTADSSAGVRTTVVALGLRPATWVCFAYFVLAGVVLLFTPFFWLGVLCMVVYGGALAYVLAQDMSEPQIFALYTRFPVLNTFVGMGVFWFLLLRLWFA